MKKFIVKTSLFVLPFAFLFAFSLLFYAFDKGDLLRLGYIIDLFPDYREQFQQENKKPVLYTKVSKLPAKRNYKFLTIGDSFSEQKAGGYQNYMADSATVLHYDRFLNYNPIQTLYALANGDFLDTFKIDYIVLENVERYFVQNNQSINVAHKTNWNDVRYAAEEHNRKISEDKDNGTDHKFFSNQSLKFAYNTFLFFTKEEDFFNEEVYKVKLNRKGFFSVNSNDLLFFKEDITALKNNNRKENITQLNSRLNELDSLLKVKGIRLIVLPSPDKFDIYYEHIENNTCYEQPRFFELFDREPKNYLYIRSKDCLQSAIKKKKDVYYYDDTHWSPVGARLIAKEILKVMP